MKTPKKPRPDMPGEDDGSPIHILWLPTIFMAGIAYIASWIDLLPDTIIGLGWLDDIAVAIAMVWFFTSWLPKNKHRVYWFSPKTKTGPQAEPQGAGGSVNEAPTGKLDPFEVLNLHRGASPEEIKLAYREMLSKYHPDKVSHLGEDFQKIAHEKAVDIQRAYEALGGKG
jgi:DnaJ like chaperone protein